MKSTICTALLVISASVFAQSAEHHKWARLALAGGDGDVRVLEVVNSHPGFVEGILLLRAAKVCKGAAISAEDRANAVALVASSLSTSLRKDGDITRGKVEREQIAALSRVESLLATVQWNALNCFTLADELPALRDWVAQQGAPFKSRIAQLELQSNDAAEIIVQQPIVEVYQAAPPRRRILEYLLPWLW